MKHLIVQCSGCSRGYYPHAHIARDGEQGERTVLSGPYLDSVQSGKFQGPIMTDYRSINDRLWAEFLTKNPDAVRPS